MEYLEQYNLSEEDINDIKDFIEPGDINVLYLDENRVKEILEYFLSIGIVNLKELLKFKISVFYEKKETIENAFNNSNIEEIVDMINEDYACLDLIGL